MPALLIVEDEEPIKAKLTNNVSWAEYGIHPVYTAGNGVEALEILERHPVTMMVTDIQMPKMNGIELIKEIKQRGYAMRIVVISGFAEFEYAQESIKLNVSDYLLKPFATKRLLDVVVRLKQELETEQAEKLELDGLRGQLSQNMARLREKWFLDLLRGDFVAASIPAQLEFLGLPEIANRTYQVAVVEISEGQLAGVTEEDKYLLNLQFANVMQRLLQESPYTHFLINFQRNQVAVIIIDPDSDLTLRLGEIITQARLAVGQSLACGVGHSYPDMADLPVSFQEACSASQYRYLYGMDQVFSINDLNLDNPSYHKLFYSLHRNPIFDNLKIGADQALRDDLTRLIGEIREARLSPELAKLIAGNLILLASTTLTELGHNTADIFGDDYLSLTDVGRAESLDELEKLLLTFFERINGFISKKRTSVNHQLIEEIRRFIAENYATDITLSGMAAQYKMSPSYLSLLFTERTGKNFIDYLTERRIKKAQELLKHTDMKIYEISNAVGYNDSFYFSNCFKKLIGQSPSEYRESVKGNE